MFSVPPSVTVIAARIGEPALVVVVLVSTESPGPRVREVYVPPLPTVIGCLVLRLAWAGGAPARASSRSRPAASGPGRRERALGTEIDRNMVRYPFPRPGAAPYCRDGAAGIDPPPLTAPAPAG